MGLTATIGHRGKEVFWGGAIPLQMDDRDLLAFVGLAQIDAAEIPPACLALSDELLFVCGRAQDVYRHP